MSGSVALGELLTLDLHDVAVEPEATYRVAGVYGFGRGVFERNAIAGSETSYKRLTKLRTDQLVLSRLKAFEGAVAVVPASIDGAYVSQEFPTFSIDLTRALPRYVDFVCRWPGFWELLRAQSKGVGARRERVHPEEFLAIEIPLPDLDEQRRVVARLEAVILRTEQIETLGKRAEELAAGARAALTRSSAPRVPLGELMEQVSRAEPVEPDKTYRLLGARWYAAGLFVREIKPGIDLAAPRAYRVFRGDFIYNRLFAWKGSFALVGEAEDGCYVSNEFPTFRVDPDRLDPGYLLAVFGQPAVWESALDRSSGGTPTSRNRLPEARFLRMEIPLPDLAKQRRIAARASQVGRLSDLSGHRVRLTSGLKASVLNRAFAGSL